MEWPAALSPIRAVVFFISSQLAELCSIAAGVQGASIERAFSKGGVSDYTRVTSMKIQQIFIISISLLASKVNGLNTLLLVDSRRK